MRVLFKKLLSRVQHSPRRKKEVEAVASRSKTQPIAMLQGKGTLGDAASVRGRNIGSCCSITWRIVIVNVVHLRLSVCVWIVVIILSLSFDGSFCSATIVVIAIAIFAFVSSVTVVTNRKIAPIAVDFFPHSIR